MTRGLNPTLDAALDESPLRAIYLAEFNVGGETIRVFSGAGTLPWNGNDYVGMGAFGRIGEVEETAGTKETGAAYELSGVPRFINAAGETHDLLPYFVDADIQGRLVKLWFGALDESMKRVAGEPELVASGLGDQIEITEGAETISIRITTENRSRGQIRSVRRVYSDADQQAEFPGDTFFSQTPALPNETFVWGREAATESG